MDKSHKPSCFNVSSFCQQSWCYNDKAWYNIAQSIPKLRISCYLQTCWQNIEELTSFLPPIIESFVSVSMAGRLNLDSSVFKTRLETVMSQHARKLQIKCSYSRNVGLGNWSWNLETFQYHFFLFHYAPRPTSQTQLFPGPFHPHGSLHSKIHVNFWFVNLILIWFVDLKYFIDLDIKFITILATL